MDTKPDPSPIHPTSTTPDNLAQSPDDGLRSAVPTMGSSPSSLKAPKPPMGQEKNVEESSGPQPLPTSENLPPPPSPAPEATETPLPPLTDVAPTTPSTVSPVIPSPSAPISGSTSADPQDQTQLEAEAEKLLNDLGDKRGGRKLKKVILPVVIGILVLTAVGTGLLVGLGAVKIPGIGEIRQQADWCNPDPDGTDYGNPCDCNGEPGNPGPGCYQCGGDGRQTQCRDGNNLPANVGTWHATGACCDQPTPPPPGGGLSCQTTQDGMSPLKIKVTNADNQDRSYQLQKCTCDEPGFPCDECNYSQQGIGAGQERTEELSISGNCGSIQLDVSPINNEFTPCYGYYSTGTTCQPPPTSPPGNQPPSCTGFTAVQDGHTVTISCTASDPDGSVNRVEFFYVPEQADGDYCNPDGEWTMIGTDTTASGSQYSVTWDVSSVPFGTYYVAGNVTDNQNAWCTGNPSGACGTSAVPCVDCNELITIEPTVPPTQPPPPPPIGEIACFELNYTPASPVLGSVITLTCSGLPEEEIDHADFRYQIDDGAFIDLDPIDALTATLSILEPGAYTAQCRVCRSADASDCTAYGEVLPPPPTGI